MPSFGSLVYKAFGLPASPHGELVRTRYPVVLVHGFGSLGTFFSRGLLLDQAMHLRLHGTLAFAPNVTPYDTSAVRSEAWSNHIEEVLRQTGAERVNLIGYSAGGLDARRLVGEFGFGERIASVITVATPNRGSELGDWILQQPKVLQSVVVGVMEQWGRLTFTEARPRVEAGLRELSPAFVEGDFNEKHPNIEGVFYGSYAGRAGRGTDTPITPLQFVQNRILFALAGINDGMVPLSSAPWGELLGVVRSDHLRMCGVAPGSTAHANRFFLHIARDLASRGF